MTSWRLLHVLALITALSLPKSALGQVVPIPPRAPMSAHAVQLDEGVPLPPQQRSTTASRLRVSTAAAAAAGSFVGIAAGLLAPRPFAPDACQETCAGMWITVPAGSILGAALGARATGVDGRDALLGSVVGFGAGILTGIVAANAEGGELAFLLTHGVVTALWAQR